MEKGTVSHFPQAYIRQCQYKYLLQSIIIDKNRGNTHTSHLCTSILCNLFMLTLVQAPPHICIKMDLRQTVRK